jgi:hypothetical protein
VLLVREEQNRLPDDLRQEFVNLTGIMGQNLVKIRADLQAICSEGTKHHSQVLSEFERYYRMTRLEHLQPMQNEIRALHFEGKENHLQLNEKLDQLSIAILGIAGTAGVVNPREGVGTSEGVLRNHGTTQKSISAHTKHDISAVLNEMQISLWLTLENSY